jgi:hypothetical protein
MGRALRQRAAPFRWAEPPLPNDSFTSVTDGESQMGRNVTLSLGALILIIIVVAIIF